MVRAVRLEKSVAEEAEEEMAAERLLRRLVMVQTRGIQTRPPAVGWVQRREKGQTLQTFTVKVVSV